MCMCVQLSSLFDRAKKVYYVTQVLNHCINSKSVCPNYKPDFRNTTSHLLQIYLGAQAKIETVIEKHVC